MRAGLTLVPCLALLIACGGGTGPSTENSTRFGGIFNLNESEPLGSTFPLTLARASSYRIMSQVYQGLVSFDPRTLTVIPCLADHWEVDPTSTIYTFHLREGVYFHDDPAFQGGKGREVTADDIVRCFTIICTKGSGDGVFWLFQDRVEGANAFYAASANGEYPGSVSGIERIDERTVRIKLTHPFTNFLQMIAHQDRNRAFPAARFHRRTGLGT
jgi:oligopeptide transport system substrate-binding protein